MDYHFICSLQSYKKFSLTALTASALHIYEQICNSLWMRLPVQSPHEDAVSLLIKVTWVTIVSYHGQRLQLGTVPGNHVVTLHHRPGTYDIVSARVQCIALYSLSPVVSTNIEHQALNSLPTYSKKILKQ